MLNSDEAVGALAALAQATRLEVFRLLVRTGPAGLVAGKIAEQLALPLPTLSFHLKTLTQAGLIRATQDGRFIVYAADFTRMNDLLRYLTEECCGGEGCESIVARCAPESCNTCNTTTS